MRIDKLYSIIYLFLIIIYAIGCNHDGTPELAITTSPPNGATGIAINTNLVATFNVDMDSSTITSTSFTLNDANNNAIAGVVSYSDKTAIFDPTNDLINNTTYTATIATTVKNLDGTALTSTKIWSFNTIASNNEGGTIPFAPTAVVATAGNTEVTISWATVANAISYNIYWATSTGVTKTTGTKISTTTSPYTQTGLTNETTYYYVVTAVNSYGESAESSETLARPSTSDSEPLAPTNLSVNNSNPPTFSWSGVSGAEKYAIQVKCRNETCNIYEQLDKASEPVSSNKYGDYVLNRFIDRSLNNYKAGTSGDSADATEIFFTGGEYTLYVYSYIGSQTYSSKLDFNITADQAHEVGLTYEEKSKISSSYYYPLFKWDVFKVWDNYRAGTYTLHVFCAGDGCNKYSSLGKSCFNPELNINIYQAVNDNSYEPSDSGDDPDTMYYAGDQDEIDEECKKERHKIYPGYVYKMQVGSCHDGSKDGDDVCDFDGDDDEFMEDKPVRYFYIFP